MLTINTKIVNVSAKSLKIKETPTAKLTAYFERPNDYDGEFGFDWYRNYFSTKLADPTKQEALKNEYTPTIINDEDYYVPWLALKKDKTATLNLKRLKKKLVN
ncbi:hypothetical protein [Saccharicrinis fermentans]|uniref:Uncharacterized protein n=1 Tax=Saccharicrinis fermentans DSM 9555 = JCM 21142 TaxID=869213 RepID=W7Y4Q0_9BACT|nr:hypothetical protein [Saccharicrinis fermentans]GAF05895.1 hypothetical protein JCM21142_124654 [Saccharicrinis fermentans DSM 9555 = JCM 21142]